jgi:indole-3-glycerol phosphate synthase
MLSRIAENKRAEVVALREALRLSSSDFSASAAGRVSLRAALSEERFSLIAEAKRISPSLGEIRADFDAVELVRRYQRAGASASTVLADADFFGGSPEVVASVARCTDIAIPIIYKDFFVDVVQVEAARRSGASAILAIVRVLDQETLLAISKAAKAANLDMIYECFNESDVALAMDCGAQIVGINNRDLESFTVDLERSLRVRRELPDSVLTVTESGLRTSDDLKRMRDGGFDAALIGETILAQPDVEAAIRQLLVGVRAPAGR